jgi:1,5-anhydro-D-fructose reductase (1,5-anhydro-D-mannitol-forming)
VALGWAVIGTGRVSQQMAAAIGRTSGADLVAVLSRSEEAGAAFAEEYRPGRTYRTLEDMLSDPAVDIVYVASPHALHALQVVSAARAGKHVLCEKPMALDTASCVEMIRECSNNGVELGIGFQHRQHPAHQFMRNLVISGRLGDVVFGDAATQSGGAGVPAWYSDRDLSGRSGILALVGVHRIDLLRYITGAEVAEVSAYVRTPEGLDFDDMVAALLTFDNGAVATVRFGFGAPQGADPIGIYGSSGSVTGIGTTSQWWSDVGGQLTVQLSDGREVKEFAKPDLYSSQVEAFHRAIRGDADGIATGTDGLRAVEIAVAIYESARTHEAVRIDKIREFSD